MTETDFNIKELVKKIEQLGDLRTQLIADGIAPLGAWIHEYTVRRQYSESRVEEYYYIKWQASDPIFKRNPKKNALPIKSNKNSQYTCHQHIGRVGSSTGLGMEQECEKAYQALANRDKLQVIEGILRGIKEKLNYYQA